MQEFLRLHPLFPAPNPVRRGAGAPRGFVDGHAPRRERAAPAAVLDAVSLDERLLVGDRYPIPCTGSNGTAPARRVVVAVGRNPPLRSTRYVGSAMPRDTPAQR